MIEKIPHTIGNQIFPLKCGFGIGYGIGRKYQPIQVSVSVSDLNQNSGFGRTLGQTFFVKSFNVLLISYCIIFKGHCQATPLTYFTIYFILIVRGFLASGTIFSSSTRSIPSFNSAAFTTTSSASVNRFVNCRLEIPL